MRDRSLVPALLALLLAARPLQAEDSLAERMLASVLRSAPGGIGVVEDRVIVSVNEHILMLTGYAREELLGKSARVFYPTDEEYEFVGREKYRQIAEKGTGSVETRWRRKDGAIIDVILSSTPLDPADLAVGVVFTVTDITERNRVARELSRRTRWFILGLAVLLALMLAVVIALARSLASRRKAERDLEQAARVQESSPVVLFRWKAAEGWPTLMVSRNVDQFGYSREELLSGAVPFAALVHPEDLGRVAAEVLDNTARGVDRFRQEYRMVTRDGQVRWVDDRTIIERDASGRAAVYQGIVIDISDRKRAEEAMARNANFLAALLDAIPTPVFYKDAELRYEGCNRAYAEVTGYATAEIRGRTFEELWPDEASEAYRNEDLDLLASPRRLIREGRARDRSGRTFPAIYSKDVFRDEKGEVAGIVGAFLDISAQKSAEEGLKTLNETLEERIRERTADLSRSNEELRAAMRTLSEAQDSLVRSEKLAALGQLIAGIAHELNTPLGAIVSSNDSTRQLLGSRLAESAAALVHLPPELLAWVEGVLPRLLATESTFVESATLRSRRKTLRAALAGLGTQPAERVCDAIVELGLEEDPALPRLLARHPETGTALEALETLASLRSMSDVIAVAAGKCGDTVRAMLYYLRQEDGEGAGPVEIAWELDNLMTLFANKMKHGVTLERRYLSRGLVSGNRNQLNQVWMNLIRNALQAMEYSGTLTLAVEDAGRGVRISVGDSGPGVDEAIRDRIFEPFFTTKPSGEGTGLGLDICRKIVERHSGSIDFESGPDGALFRVELPALTGG